MRTEELVIFDIETVGGGDAVLDRMMPEDVKNPRMPYELENPGPMPDWENRALKDPAKIEAWRAQKAEDWRNDIKNKIDKWNRDSLERRLKWIEKAALSPETGVVKTIAYLGEGWITVFVGDKVKPSIGADVRDWLAKEGFKEDFADVSILAYDGEAAMLRDAWQWMFKLSVKERRKFAGWSSNNFDVPFLRKRSWINGIQPKLSVTNGFYVDRENWLDLMEEWATGDRQLRVGCNHVARALGVREKNGDGGQFEEMWKRNPSEAICYNINDVIVESLIARRMGFQLAAK